MWIAKDNDNTVWLCKEKPIWRGEFGIWQAFEWEAIMWLGMDLKRLNEPNPYPESYNPNNTTIEPTADNLKL